MGEAMRRFTIPASAIGAVLLAAAPAEAGAGVRIGPDRVVVSAQSGRVVVARNPLRLSFQTRGGRTVLRQTAGGRRATRLAPTMDPEPFSLEREPDRPVYSPFVYEVGTERRAQWKGSYWAGNLLFARRSGTVHHARRVIRVRRSGRGVRMVLATTEPGRRLLVRIAPDKGGTLRLRARPSRSTGVINMGDSFQSPRREAFHGFGGRHGSVNKRGEKLANWVEQENFGGKPTLSATALLPGLTEQGTDFTIGQLGGGPKSERDLPGGYERYMVPGGQNAAYYVQNQFISSRGYGFLLNHDELSRWRMAVDRPAWRVQATGARLDYTVAPGGPRKAIRDLTSITGRHRVPPAWAQGATLWRLVQVAPGKRETAETYRAKIEADLADLTRYRVSIKAYAFEGWGILGPKVTADIIRRLHRRGIRAILYHRAYVSNDPLNTQPPGDYEEVLRKGLAAKDRRGRPFFYDANGAPGVVLDFTNPATLRWWKRRLELTLRLGADGFMQDFGEQVLDGMRFHDGSTGRTMHNRYPVLFHRASRRIVDAWDRRNPAGGPTWFFTRSGFSGRPGSAAYEMGNFPGDETADWSAGSGLRSLAPDMLNRAVGGAFGYTTDIGGYADLLTGPPNAELFTRWHEWAALSPYFRLHNSASSNTRMPWSYDAVTLQRWKSLAALHQRALPYIRRLWRAGRRTGVPVTRPLWMDAGGNARVAAQSQEWLLGPDVLVAPVVQEGASGRVVVFPAGCWRDPRSGRRVRGPSSRTVRAPLGQLPYFFRCGKRPF